MKTLTTLALAVALVACSKDKDGPAKPTETAEPARTEPARTEPARPAPSADGVVGKKAPDFTLEDLEGEKVSLASFAGKVVVLEWFNPGCPFVTRAHTAGSLVDTAKRHTDNGVVWLAINSGAPGKQGAEAEANKAAASKWNMDHPILLDPTGATGKAYGATNTPHMFVINKEGVVVYAGAIDNSPDAEGKSPSGGELINYVDAAIEALSGGREVATPVTKAYGCSVKYAS